MARLTDRILRRVRGHGRGNWVCTPKDFLDLGSRAAVDQALSRLVKRGQLRRIGRGLYDLPRYSRLLKRSVPPRMNTVVAALARREGARIMPDTLTAANGLGLTDAVPAKASYVTDGRSRTLNVAGRTIYLRHASRRLMAWSDRPAAPVIQVLNWLGKDLADDPKTIDALRARLPDVVKRDLRSGFRDLPSWAIPIVNDITSVGRAVV